MGVARQKWQSAKGRLNAADFETLLRPKEKFGSNLDLAESLMGHLESKLKGLLSEGGKFDSTATAAADAARRYNEVLVGSAVAQRVGGQGVTPRTRGS